LQLISPDKCCRLAGIVRARYASKTLKTFEFVAINDHAPALTEIRTKLVFEENNLEIERLIGFRMMNENAQGRGAARGKPNTTWIVLNWDNV